VSWGDPGSAASEYARVGRPVFPCYTSTHDGCSCHRADCHSPGKHPRTPNGLHDATTDAAVIERWWRRWPDANVGVVTGRPSGLVVVDVDPGHGGIETMRQLVAEYGPLPSGPRVRTGSGGWHVLFAWPGHEVRNSAGRVGPGVDIRGDGGYVIAPPSVHSAGERYVWTSGGQPPQVPDWLARLIEPPRAEHASTRDPIPIGDALDRWASAALRGEIERVRCAHEGARNHTLNRAAFALGQIAGSGALDTSAIEAHLLQAAVSTGLGEREAALTIRSGMNAGMARPRGPVDRMEPSASPVAPRAVESEHDAEVS